MPTTIRPTDSASQLERSAPSVSGDGQSSAIALDPRELHALLERAERDPALLAPFLREEIERSIREATAGEDSGAATSNLGSITVSAADRACIADFGGASYLVEIGLSSDSRPRASVRGAAKPFSE